MRTITLITLFLLSSSSAFCQQPCAPAGVPPCGPERNWPSAPQQAPPTIIVKVPQRIVMEGGSCQPPPSAPPAAAPPSAPAAPPGMFVAPPQTGTVMGERNSIMLHGPALHMPEFRIGLPSLELPSFQRMRQEARMNLSPAVAPYEQAPTLPPQAPAMFVGQYNPAQPPNAPAPQAPSAPAAPGAGSCQPGRRLLQRPRRRLVNRLSEAQGLALRQRRRVRPRRICPAITCRPLRRRRQQRWKCSFAAWKTCSGASTRSSNS